MRTAHGVKRAWIAGIVASLWVLVAIAQIPEKFQNPKVLPQDISRQALLAEMDNFAGALGVQRNYGHAGGDPVTLVGVRFAFDEKLEKVRAREIHRPHEKQSEITEIPFDSARNQILINVFVNGKGPFLMSLDTGTSPSVLDLSFAKQMELPIEPIRRPGAGAGTEEIVGYKTDVREVAVGNLRQENLLAVAVDMSKSIQRLGRDLKGVLGSSFLEGKVVEIDYARRTVAFLDSPRRQENSCGRVAVPMQFNPGDSTPTINELYVNNKPVRANLDTGSSLSVLLLSRAMEHLGLRAQAEKAKPSTAVGYGGEADLRDGAVESLRIGALAAQTTEVSFAWRGWKDEPLSRRGASVGNGLLKEFVVTFDYRQRSVVFEKVCSPPCAPSEPRAPAEGNEAAIRRFFEEIQNQGKPEAIPEVFSSRAAMNGQPINMEAMKKNLSRADRAFDSHITIEEMIARDDVVVTRATAHLKHIGEWFGLPASNKIVSMRAIDFFRLENGKIVEQWHVADRLGTIVELGGLPLSGRTAAPLQDSRGVHPYGSAEPITTPSVFGEGVISTGDYESHPAFTPDGRTLYFVKSTPTFSFWTIVVSRFADGRWTTPEVAPFSGQYSDADPFITADGKQFYFISRRPASGKAMPDLDIWVIDKTESGWSEPRNLGTPINTPGNEWYPTLAADGTLYFGSDRPGGKGGTDIYRSRLVNGKYSEPENLGDALNTEFEEFEPYIAPDQSYLIFMAAGRPDGRGGGDLYISHFKDGAWTKAQNLGAEINSPRDEYSPKVSPDGKYFFFASARGRRPPDKPMNSADLLGWLRGTRNGLGDIYQVDVRSVLPSTARTSPGAQQSPEASASELDSTPKAQGTRCQTFLANKSAGGVSLEKLQLAEGQVRVIRIGGENDNLDLILPVGPGQAGNLVQAADEFIPAPVSLHRKRF